MKNEKKYILIGDDEKEILDILNLLLTGEGYEVLAVKNGQEAVTAASEEIDLYILDVNMPELSGFMAAAQIRKKYDTPIIFLTASAAVRQGEQASDRKLSFCDLLLDLDNQSVVRQGFFGGCNYFCCIISFSGGSENRLFKANYTGNRGTAYTSDGL